MIRVKSYVKTVGRKRVRVRSHNRRGTARRTVRNIRRTKSGRGIKGWKKITDNDQQMSWEKGRNFITISARFQTAKIKNGKS